MKKIVTNPKISQIDTDSNSQITIDIITDQSDATLSLEGQKINYNKLENLPEINNVVVSGNHNGSYYGLVDAVEGKGLSTNDFTDELKEKVESIDNLDQSISEEITARENAIEEVNQSISEEITARENAIEEVNQSIVSLGNTLSEEISSQVGIEEARATEKENELSNSISEEITAREAAIEEVNQSISNEISARENAIEEVNQSISTLNTTLRSVITSEVNNEKTRATTKENELSNSISDEVSARKSADTNLQNQINTANSNLQSAVTDYNTKINNEKTRATNAENSLSERISTNTSNITKEVNDRKAAINNLSNVYVQKQTTINGKPLSSNINLTASDIGALPSSTVIGNATLTIQKNGTTVDTFKANATSNKTINITVPTKTSEITNDSEYTNQTQVQYMIKNSEEFVKLNNKINEEAEIRKEEDDKLQAEIDAITVSSDVRDIVGTYQDLENYDKSKLIDGDIIKVLSDSTHNDALTYYRFIYAEQDYQYIGSEGPFYTKTEANITFVPQTTTINSHELSENITLTYEDVGALSNSTTIEDLTSNAQQNALNSGITSALVEQIGTNESNISNINTTIGTYGNIVTHNTSEFATSSQGAKADTALQPNNPITGATKCKITYDSNGLVTAGADLIANDIPDLSLSKIADVTATTTEVNYLSGVTSSIQTQINSKQNTIDSSHKLSSDLVDDTNATNLFVTNSEKTTWSGKQDELVSGTNIKTINGSSVLGSGNLELSQFLGFPSNWPTTSSTTTKQFCDVVAEDSSAVAGKMYLGEVRWSDLSTVGLVNAEVTVSIMSGNTANTKVILLEMTSGNHSPYKWQYTYWNHGSNVSGWIGFQPKLTQGTGITINNNTISANAMTGADGTHSGTTGIVPAPTATDNTKYLKGDGTWAEVDALPSQVGNAGKFLTTDGTDTSWEEITIPDVNLMDIADEGQGIELIHETQNSYGYTTEGTLTNVDNIISGFSTSNYIDTGYAFNPGSNAWEFECEFYTSNSVSGTNYLLGNLDSSNNQSFVVGFKDDYGDPLPFAKITLSDDTVLDLYDPTAWHNSLLPNEKYFIRVKFNGTNEYSIEIKGNSNYNDDSEWYYCGRGYYNLYIKENNGNIIIGKDPKTNTAYSGSINENYLYFKIGNEVDYRLVKGKTEIGLKHLSGPAVLTGYQTPDYTVDGLLGQIYIDVSGSNKAYICISTDNVWKEINELPDQYENDGKFLTTNGMSVSWQDVPNSQPTYDTQHERLIF